MINLNNKEDYIKEFKVFNDGETGIVTPVEIRIERKKDSDADNAPDYKLIGKDKNGEINEGFYYQENADSNGFKNYQAGKLINLVEGIMGEGTEIPEAESVSKMLDIVMEMIAKASQGNTYRVVATYGTTNRPNRWLQFKSFGSFVESTDIEASKLKLEPVDIQNRPDPESSSKEEIKDALNKDEDWLKG